MKALHVIRDLSASTGGPVSALQNICRSQQLADIDPRIVTNVSLNGAEGFYETFDSGNQAEKTLSPGFTSVDRKLRNRRLKQALHEVQVVHLHGVWEGLLRSAARSAGAARKQVIWTPHGMVTQWAMSQSKLKKGLYWRLAMRPSLPATTVQHFASTAERDATVSVALLDRTCVVPLSIDTESFGTAANPEFLAERFGIDGPSVLFVGRVHPGKGVEHLVAAAAHLPRKTCTFVIAGPADSAWAKGLQDRIGPTGPPFVFTGPLEPTDIASALRSAALFCLPSDHENFSMATAEAMCCGTATLLSREVAIAAPAVAEQAALFCRRDPKGLAADIADAFSDPARLSQTGDRAARYAREHFSLRTAADRWRNLYQATP